MSITAMKQALEALEANQPFNYCMNNNGIKFPMMQEGPFRFERNTKAITALRQAIEQAEQAQPVAWCCFVCGGTSLLCLHGQTDVPLYTAPPLRQPLTDEQISKLWDEHTCPLFGKKGINPIEFTRAIEAAHGIKGEA